VIIGRFVAPSFGRSAARRRRAAHIKAVRPWHDTAWLVPSGGDARRSILFASRRRTVAGRGAAQLRIIYQTGNDPKQPRTLLNKRPGFRLPDSDPNKTAASCRIYETLTPNTKVLSQRGK